ncbi:uncharacterized protein LOC109823935 [Asparagus officinalis]|uniref:uncharacterized protein LOC109823935 n=1 Tax=Asparagus officinalis TaxID=4686 RepID=UPI00098E60B2|nr:uncharacterized protein LOC109823935 [Asparagus officinalis]XP_020245988.1 uncharacterized protein LOC109823935 [Asparagus officinalis]
MATHENCREANNKKTQIKELLQSKPPSDLNSLLTINLSTLKTHYESQVPESKTLNLAVNLRSQSQSWTIWACPRCSLTFTQPQFLSHHVLEAHLRPNKELFSLLPKKAERRIVDEFLSDSSQPEAIRSAVQKLKTFDVLTETQLNILYKIDKPLKIREMVAFVEDLVSECSSSSSCSDKSEESEDERILVDGSKLVLNVKNAEALFSWLYDDEEEETGFCEWDDLKREKRNRGDEIIEKIEKELEILETICIKKHSLLRYKNAVVILEKVFLDLVARTGQNQEAVMRKIRGDLAERSGNDNDVLRHVAANVHKEVASMKASKMRNLVKVAMKEDTSTVEAFKMLNWDSDFEVAKCDAKLIRKSIELKLLEVKLEHAAALDHLAVVEPLVKSYLRRHLEEEAKLNDAAEE